MKLKVCGMKYPENIAELVKLPIDWMGLIFHEQSPRFVGDLDAAFLQTIPSSIRLTGVFVNKSKEYILDKVEKYRLKTVQLHGSESPVLCKELKSSGVEVIKAFQVENPDDLRECVFYETACDYFLFDTKTLQYGGSGKKFDWKILSAYSCETPFFLSGGIDLEDIETIKRLKMKQIHAIDINSKFEIAPGIKDINKIKMI